MTPREGRGAQAERRRARPEGVTRAKRGCSACMFAGGHGLRRRRRRLGSSSDTHFSARRVVQVVSVIAETLSRSVSAGKSAAPGVGTGGCAKTKSVANG